MFLISISGLVLVALGYFRKERNLMLAGAAALWASGGMLNFFLFFTGRPA